MLLQKEIEIKDLSAFRLWVDEFSAGLKAPVIVLLKGPMGAGKTEFVKQICQSFGLQTPSSPSFAVHNQYQNSRVLIHHFDLFRLKDDQDIESTGFWDFFSELNAMVFIEWPERIQLEELPIQWPKIMIEIVKTGEHSRKIII